MEQFEEFILKGAEATGSPDMPISPSPAGKAIRHNPSKSIPKTGEAEPAYEATKFAMPSLGRYPLDSYASVKQACAYFEEYGGQFTPAQRREFCSNLTKRASELGIGYSEKVAKYGASTYARPAELESALLVRQNMVSDELRPVFDQVKQASAVHPPEEFAALLAEFDKMAGLEQYYGRGVADPYFTTFGVR